MPMPETAVNENGRAMLWKDDVGRPWEISAVNTISETSLMQALPNDDFGRGVRAPDLSHQGASLFGC